MPESDLKTINKKIGRIGIPIVLFFFAGLLTYGFYKGYQIHHHFAFTTGSVTRIIGPAWGSTKYDIIFEYYFVGILVAAAASSGDHRLSGDF